MKIKCLLSDARNNIHNKFNIVLIMLQAEIQIMPIRLLCIKRLKIYFIIKNIKL